MTQQAPSTSQMWGLNRVSKAVDTVAAALVVMVAVPLSFIVAMVLIILAPLLFTGAGLVLFLAVIQALARH